MNSSSGEPPSGDEPASNGRLDSWKEIASYLRRSVRTAKRWEKEQELPIHRHHHDKRDSVYAYATELDAWWSSRGAELVDLNGAEDPVLPTETEVVGNSGVEELEREGKLAPLPARPPRTAALLAAGFALAALLVGVMIWLFRNGSGPSAGSLRPVPFKARDWVLVTSFENRTGEPVLDGTVEYALERELSNSRYVNVVSRQRIGDALRLMRKPVDTRVDAATGREICLRDGEIRGLITGRIERLGRKYLLSVELVDPSQGASIASVAEEATGDEQLLPATRRVSDRVRAMLGENPPSTHHGEGDLLKVTTPSLRALQLYSRADTLIAQGKMAAAEELLKQAVAEDPDFASAHILLAFAIRNQGKAKEELLPEAETAYRLSDRTTERERYFIRGSYNLFLGEREKAVAAYEALLSMYPDHVGGTENLIGLYNAFGRTDEAVRCAVHMADLRPKDFRASFMAASFLARLGPDPARARLHVRRALDLVSPEVMESSSWEVALLELFPANERWLEGDAAGALDLGTRFAEKLESTPLRRQSGAIEHLGNFFLTIGRLRTAEELSHRLSEPTFFPTRLSLIRGNQKELRRQSSLLVPHSSRLNTTDLGLFLARTGQTDRAERLLTEAERSSSYASWPLEALRGELAMARGRTAEAIRQMKKSQESTGNFGYGSFFLGTETLASALARQGDMKGAVQVLENASRQKRRAVFHYMSNGALWTRNQLLLARLYRSVGRIADAQRIEAELKKLLAVADSDHPILLELERLVRTAAIVSTSH